MRILPYLMSNEGVFKLEIPAQTVAPAADAYSDTLTITVCSTAGACN